VSAGEAGVHRNWDYAVSKRARIVRRETERYLPRLHPFRLSPLAGAG